MGDDKTFTGADDRRGTPGGDDPDVRHLAERHGIPLEDARDLLRRYGNDQPVLEREIRKLQNSRQS